MGGNLAKTPLTAACYAALFYFTLEMLPWSEGFLQKTQGFVMPTTGYLLIIGYGLWVSLALALLWSGANAKGLKLLLPALVSLLGLQWVLPLLRQMLFGEVTGVMTQPDTLLLLAAGCIAGVLLLVLALLLFSGGVQAQGKPALPAKATAKYKIKPLGLIIRVLVLPVIFCVLYFLLYYLLLWPNAAARAYYGGVENQGIIAEVIYMLLNNARMVPMVLCEGLLAVLCAIPLMMQLQAKRGLYIVVNTMLCASGALLMFLPGPLMQDAVRISHFITFLAIYAPYGAFSAFLLHTGLSKIPPPPTPPPAPAVPAASAARPGAPAGVKRLQ